MEVVRGLPKYSMEKIDFFHTTQEVGRILGKEITCVYNTCYISGFDPKVGVITVILGF